MTRKLALLALLSAYLALPGDAFSGVRRENHQYWISTMSSAMPTATSTNFGGCQGALSTSTTIANRQQVNAGAGVVDSLYVRLSGDVGAGGGPALVVTLNLNGSDTALTCTITGGAGTELSCTDTTHVVTVAPGDLCAVKFAVTGTLNGSLSSTTSIRFRSQHRREATLMQHQVTLASAQRFGSGYGGYTSAARTTESLLQPAPTAATLRAVYCATPTAPDNGAGTQTWTHHARVNQADADGAGCVISETATASSITGLSLAIAAGDKLSSTVTPAATPATAAQQATGWLLQMPGDDYTWIYSSDTGTLSAAGQTFGSLAAIETRSATESVVQTNAPAAGIISNLRGLLSADPTPGTFTIAGRKAAADQALTCAIAAGNTTCSDATHSFSCAADDALSFGSTPSASPGSVSGHFAALFVGR